MMAESKKSFLDNVGYFLTRPDAEFYQHPGRVIGKYFVWALLGAGVMAAIFYGAPGWIAALAAFGTLKLGIALAGGAVAGLGLSMFVTGFREIVAPTDKTNRAWSTLKVALGAIMATPLFFAFGLYQGLSLPVTAAWMGGVAAVSAVMTALMPWSVNWMMPGEMAKLNVHPGHTPPAAISAVRKGKQRVAEPSQEVISDAIHQGDVEKLTALLDRGLSVDHVLKPERRMTLLAEVIASKQIEDEATREAMVSLLIGRKATVDQPNSKGSTPLLIAVIESREGCVPLLLQAGADPAIKNSKGTSAASRANRGSAIASIIQKHLREQRRQSASPAKKASPPRGSTRKSSVSPKGSSSRARNEMGFKGGSSPKGGSGHKRSDAGARSKTPQ